MAEGTRMKDCMQIFLLLGFAVLGYAQEKGKSLSLVAIDNGRFVY